MQTDLETFVASVNMILILSFCCPMKSDDLNQQFTAFFKVISKGSISKKLEMTRQLAKEMYRQIELEDVSQGC